MAEKPVARLDPSQDETPRLAVREDLDLLAVFLAGRRPTPSRTFARDPAHGRAGAIAKLLRGDSEQEADQIGTANSIGKIPDHPREWRPGILASRDATNLASSPTGEYPGADS